MKESKKCGLIALVYVFLAVVSMGIMVYAVTQRSLVNALWNMANMVAVGVLAFLFWGLRNQWLELGD